MRATTSIFLLLQELLPILMLDWVEKGASTKTTKAFLSRDILMQNALNT